MKNELIKKVVSLEIERLNKLSTKDLKSEYSEWFELECKENRRSNLISELMEDFESYRKDDGIEELEEIIESYTL